MFMLIFSTGKLFKTGAKYIVLKNTYFPGPLASKTFFPYYCIFKPRADQKFFLGPFENGNLTLRSHSAPEPLENMSFQKRYMLIGLRDFPEKMAQT